MAPVKATASKCYRQKKPKTKKMSLKEHARIDLSTTLESVFSYANPEKKTKRTKKQKRGTLGKLRPFIFSVLSSHQKASTQLYRNALAEVGFF